MTLSSSAPDATALAAEIRAGRRTPEALWAETRARIEALNPELNAVVRLTPTPPPAGDGPFAGVPWLIKELLPYPSVPTPFGSRLTAQFVAPQHSPYTARLAASGLMPIGASASSEFGLLGSTETRLHGVTRNPWGHELSVGGSSGGAAAAVAAGIVPLAHANDGGGSIRIPAALTGLFGFKPSANATAPTQAEPTPFSAQVSEHCISRSVRDSATLLAVTGSSVESAPADLPPLRIGVYTTDAFGRPACAESQAAVEAAIPLCRALGHAPEPVAAPPLDGPAISQSFFTLAGAAVAGICDMLTPMLGRAPGSADLEPFTASLLARARRASADELVAAQATLAAQGEQMRAFLSTVDVALCPTIGGARPKLGDLAPHLPADVLIERTERLSGFTAIHNPAGAPAMSVPLGWTDDGLPVGVQFAASPGRDALLLRLAAQLERLAPWANRRPPLSL